MFLAAVPSAFAALSASDPFPSDGPPGYNTGNLVGQGPATLGFSGAWLEGYAGAQSPSVVAGGLAYGDGIHNMTTSGGAIEYAGGGFGRAGRLLTAPYTDGTNGTVYFAFLIQLDGVADVYRGVEMHSGGFDDGANRKIQIVTGEGGANPNGGDRFTIRLFGSNFAGFSGDLGAANTNVNLFVGKISFSSAGDGDSIQLWRNPADLSSEALSGAPVFEKAGFNLQIDRTSIARFNGSNGCAVDEIRFGASWSDVTTVIGAADSDGDGLPDTWETNNGLDPGDDGSIDPINGAGGDPDSDGSPNSEEFANGTDPQDADTDNDGLDDGDEAGVESDPLNPDTDGDLLSDGDEVNNHSTDPTLADSDSDGVNDATEVFAGSDPNLVASLPANERPALVGLDHFDYSDGLVGGLTGGELFDHDNSLVNDGYYGHTGDGSTWAVAFGNPVINHGRLFTRDSAATRPFNGNATGGEGIALFDDQSALQFLYAKVKVTREPGASWSGLSFMVNGQEETFFGVSGNVFGIEESGQGNSMFSSIVANDHQAYNVVVKIDCFAGVAYLWVDPDLGQSEPAADVELVTHLFSSTRGSAVRLGSGGTGRTRWDDLVVGTTWSSLQSGGTDSEPDGLRDSWEDHYAGDLVTLTGAGNNDSDSLTNLQEQATGTDPLSADTDTDGSADDDELTAGTDPLEPDTDGDGLEDGDEVTLGSDPLDPDTDGDGERDGLEVAQGTDPLDPDSSSAALGLVIVDGSRDAVYGDPLSVQTVNTEFGDNLSEWNAAYAYVKNGRLHLMLTGNLESNFSKLEILIDSTSAISTNIFEAAGNDGTENMDGLTFDAGFSPDYHLIVRRGGGDRFDLDIANLATKAFTFHGDVFDGAMEGSAFTGTGAGNSSPIGVGYDNSNTAGVTGGGAAADPEAAAAVLTGLELSIALSDLGNPSGTIRIAVMQNGTNHDFLSNQILGGLPAPQGNLAGDGSGNFTGNLSGIDFNSFAGDQFFVVTVPAQSHPHITSVQMISGNAQIQFTVEGLVEGNDYKVRDSETLLEFTDVAGTQFTASGTSQVITLPVNTALAPKRFFIVTAGP